MNTEEKKPSNYYLILDLMPGVTHNDILHAYNRAKNTYSSGSLASYTLLEDESNTSIMEDIEKAFAILGNPAKRRAYDIQMGFNTWSEESESASTHNNITAMASPSSSRFSSAREISSDAMSMAELDDVKMDEPQGRVIPLKAKAPIPAKQHITPAPNKDKIQNNQFEPIEFEKKIQEVVEVDGSFLRAVRIYRCYTVESLAHRCKLSASHISAIEEESAGNLHQAVYLRGHIYLICQALDIPNPQQLAKNFVDRMVQTGKLTKKNF